MRSMSTRFLLSCKATLQFDLPTSYYNMKYNAVQNVSYPPFLMWELCTTKIVKVDVTLFTLPDPSYLSNYVQTIGAKNIEA